MGLVFNVLALDYQPNLALPLNSGNLLE